MQIFIEFVRADRTAADHSVATWRRNSIVMTTERCQSVAIVGHDVRLEPLTWRLLPELYGAIAHLLVFDGGCGGGFGCGCDGGPGGLRMGLTEFTDWADAYVLWAGLPCAVRLVGGPHDGDLVGMSTLDDLHLEHMSAHRDWTVYDPRGWEPPSTRKRGCCCSGWRSTTGSGG